MPLHSRHHPNLRRYHHRHRVQVHHCIPYNKTYFLRDKVADCRRRSTIAYILSSDLKCLKHCLIDSASILHLSSTKQYLLSGPKHSDRYIPGGRPPFLFPSLCLSSKNFPYVMRLRKFLTVFQLGDARHPTRIRSAAW